MKNRNKRQWVDELGVSEGECFSCCGIDAVGRMSDFMDERVNGSLPMLPPDDADMAEPPTPAKLALANDRCSCDIVSWPMDIWSTI